MGRITTAHQSMIDSAKGKRTKQTKSWPDGRKYNGEMLNGEPDGHGTMKYHDEHSTQYVRRFRQGIRHDKRTTTDTNGYSYTGWRVC